MKRLRIYVDTSVIGGCFDPEFRAWSNGRFTRPERLQHMSEKIEIRSVEMVRCIRDELADVLKGKSHPEIIEFFKKAGDTARRKCKRPESI